MKRKLLDKVCLIITGCIKPDNDMPMLFLKSQEERKKQYLQSIRYYIENTNVINIVFCDNSGAEPDLALINLANDKGKNFEWLSFNGDLKKSVECGKGYGEGEILKYAMQNSKIIMDCEIIIKITGRMIVKNINSILFLMHYGENYFYPVVEEGGKPFVCTKIFIVKKGVFSNSFVDSFIDVKDDCHNYIEHVYAKVILNSQCSYKILPLNPMILGMSGTTGEMYKPSLIKQLWYDFRMHIFKK